MNTQNYTINIRPGWGVSPVVKVSQGDVGRPLAFTIMDGAEALDIESGTTVTMQGTKPSTLGFTQTCEVSGNVATIATTETMTQESGAVQAELILMQGTTVIGSSNFVIYVEPSAHPEGTTDGDAETARDLMTRAEQAVEQAEASAEAISQAGIDTTGATAGQVPTANGSGSWSWADPQGAGGTSDDIENASSVTGTTVSDALNSLSDEIASLSGGAPTPVATAAGMIDTTKIYLYTGSETGYTAGHWYYYSGNQWVDGGQYGQASSLSNAVKTALLQIAEKVWYTDEYGRTYYEALYDALYPPKNLISITAVYTQSGEVYDNDSLDVLKSGLVVTANWDDGTSTTETDYTLSGTLTTGTSTITVLYEGKTATFTVTVTHAVQQYTITNTLTECTNSNAATRVNELTAYTGTLTANTGYVMGTVSISMGGTDVTSTVYDATTGAISIASVTGNITITAEAVDDVGWVSGVPYTIEWSEGGYTVNNTSGEVGTSSNANDHVTSLLPCHGASAVLGSSNPYGSFCFYDENESFIQSWKLNTGIENPGRCPVPRNAYYVRAYWRNSSPETSVTVTPYKFTTLTETTTWELNKYYELEYADGYEAVSKKSELGLCYGAQTFQCGMYSRSFIYFYDSEKQQIGNYTIRQNSATEISIPEGAYYVALDPGTIGTSGNTNNPWIKFTS